MQTCEAREFYTTAEVAAILRQHPKAFYRRVIKRGRIAYHQDGPGAAITIRHADLQGYLASIRVDVRPEKERTNNPGALR